MSFLAFIKNGKKVKNNFMPAKYPASRVSYDDNGTETNVQAKVSELSADITRQWVEVSNGSDELANYRLLYVILKDNWVQGANTIGVLYCKNHNTIFPYNTYNAGSMVTCTFRLIYKGLTKTISVDEAHTNLSSNTPPTIAKIYGIL